MRFRPALTLLEDRLTPSFDHLGYAQFLFGQMPPVIRNTVHAAGYSEYGDIRPIWNDRLDQNAELSFLGVTYASGAMVRSPWTGNLTVYYLVNVCTSPTAVDSLVGHEFVHWFDWSYREAYYGLKASQGDWWSSIWAASGYAYGDREEAFAIYSAAYLIRAQTGPSRPDANVYFANLYGPPDVAGLPIGGVFYWPEPDSPIRVAA